jgi:hypothetical protein
VLHSFVHNVEHVVGIQKGQLQNGKPRSMGSQLTCTGTTHNRPTQVDKEAAWIILVSWFKEEKKKNVCTCGSSEKLRLLHKTSTRWWAYTVIASDMPSNITGVLGRTGACIARWPPNTGRNARVSRVLTVKIRQPNHEFTFSVGISFIPYPLILTPVV